MIVMVMMVEDKKVKKVKEGTDIICEEKTKKFHAATSSDGVGNGTMVQAELCLNQCIAIAMLSHADDENDYNCTQTHHRTFVLSCCYCRC